MTQIMSPFLNRFLLGVTNKLIYPISSRIILSMFFDQYGKNVRIFGRPRIYKQGKLNIGDNAIINSTYRNNPIGGMSFSSFWIKEGAEINIGNNSKISNSAFVASTKIEIGENVYIGGNCKIYDTDFHSINIQNRLKSNDPDINSRSTILKDNCFIGAGTIILKGVRIRKESVIGAGAVVTKSVPDHQVWGGNPARFIKEIENG